MQVIQHPAALINVVIGEQKIDKNVKYRLLYYCITVIENDIALIYNNITKELLKLTKEEFELISKNSFFLNNEFLQTLTKKWFLVPEEYNDFLLSQQVTSLAKQFASNSNIVFYNIVTTTACNARCFYCFEADAEVSMMSADTAKAVAEYIAKHCGGKNVKINWFGGEPFCNISAIDSVTTRLKELNVEFSSTATTNGYLLDEKTVCKAANLWNLRAVQITLDGMHETYKKVKNYKNNDTDPLERVVNNIGGLINSGIAVTVRLNMDSHNSKELFELVDYLADKFKSSNKFAIYAHLLFENTGFIKKSRSDEQRKSIADKFFKLRDYIVGLGLWSHGMKLEKEIKTCFCIADSSNAVLISPKGKIGKCERTVDSDFVSDIYSDIPVKPWSDYCKPINRCYTCAFYPSCMRLRDCPNCQNECYEHEQKQRLSDLKLQVLNKYKNSNK